ncbi:PREDICTED: splicing factor 45 [Papilio polytes]|uniref:splicing factor 45 n=1 Tax=Papilio polytes TaxID=76194 RepID=UPI0006769C9C|nr:PREDICTED: splicing factor 45 [Papilio polytes]XP_013134776.1 PREDICTED: splicing factor 45 [Papilio polytes]
MSLYDDLDTIKTRTTEKVAAWSSGIKLLQSQLQLKKAAITQPKREALRRSTQVLTPVIDLKSKQKDEDESNSNNSHMQPKNYTPLNVTDFDWNVANEYDPMWPNDYEKVAKEIQNKRLQLDGGDRIDRADRKRKSRFGDDEETIPEKTLIPMQPEEEEAVEICKRAAGAAIAPPPSLTVETAAPSPPSPSTPIAAPTGGFSIGGYGASSVAAKIMAKYGFKEGQGLGKKEQGMSVALQVEKTSKRGGRIIHEKDGSTMPPPGFTMPPPPGPDSPNASSNSPQMLLKSEPSITEIMKSPSKVVLLRNMVGPGDVDEELEPEVKDECNTKYGDVIKVVIFEMPNAPNDEAVRIFVEFKRIESAIKAVVDLNGRFFGGRQVKAGFYDMEKFNVLLLTE